MQTIETRYLGATNSKPQRIKAQTSSGSCPVTVNYNDGLSEAGNHQRAAQVCLEKTGWQIAEMVGGSTKSGWAFVTTNNASPVISSAKNI